MATLAKVQKVSQLPSVDIASGVIRGIVVHKDKLGTGARQAQAGQPRAAEAGESQRKHFLREVGMAALVDPFLDGVAEQEIGRVEDINGFASYYTPPGTGEGPALTIDDLRASEHSFVFASPGSGKTTLRLMLDVACRLEPDGALVVESPFDLNVTRPLTEAQHARRLAASLAVDLVLQIIEQAPERAHAPGWLLEPERVAALARQLQAGGHSLRQKVIEMCAAGSEHPGLADLRSKAARRELNDEQKLQAIKLHSLGLGMYWPGLGRYPVQYVSIPDDLREALRSALRQPTAPRPAGWDELWQGVADARAWGFDRVLILIDGVDAAINDSAEMLDLLAPLLTILPAAQEHGVSFKFFAPLQVKPGVTGWLEKEQASSGLYSKYRNATINWTHPALVQLLLKRFHAAGLFTLNHLNELVDPRLRSKRGKRSFEGQLLEKSGYEPRKLIQLVNQLIELHAEREPAQFNFSQDDLDQLKI